MATTDAIERHGWAYLWLGIAAILLWFSTPQWVIPLAVWLAPVFVLRFMHSQGIVKGTLMLWLVVSLIAGFANFGFVPLPLVGHLIYTPIASLVAVLPYIVERSIAPRLCGFQQTLVLPLAFTTLDYLQSFFYSGTIVSPAYTQSGNLALSQLAAVTGVWGITFLIFWCAAVIHWSWTQQWRWLAVRRSVLSAGLVVGLIVVLGEARLVLAPSAAPTVRVAAISVDYLNVGQAAYVAKHGKTVHINDDLAAASADVLAMQQALNEFFVQPDEPRFVSVHDQLRALYDELFRLSEREARAGAKIVVWSEANALVLKADEPGLIARGQALARAQGIYLFMPMVTMTSGTAAFSAGGNTVENKIIALGPDGRILATYFKTKLPIGDASIRGDGSISVIDTPYGRIAAVICYDMDTPSYIRQAGQAGVDIMLAPSGDWQAITPWHANAAVFRSIENGFALVRPVSRGLFVAADQHGQILGTLNFFNTPERVLVVNVPTAHVWTLYTLIGDSFALLCVAGLVSLVGRIAFHRTRSGFRVGSAELGYQSQ